MNEGGAQKKERRKILECKYEQKIRETHKKEVK